MSSSSPLRPLLVNGEGLRIDVTAPRSVGGAKYDPQTPEEARAILLPQVNAVVSTVRSLPRSMRADEHVYVEARLLPNYIAPSHFPDALLSRVNAVSVGSRADVTIHRTKSKATRAGTRRIIMALTDNGLSSFAAMVAHGGTRGDRQAFAEIRKFDQFLIPDSSSVIQARPDETSAPTTWEAVLNPAPSYGAEIVPLDDGTMEKWLAFIAYLGGQAHRDYIRQVGGLTFSPVTISEGVIEELARFNPLRSLRPMPAIRPRPTFGRRAFGRVVPPVDTTPVQPSPRVAVFDGGIDNEISSSILFPQPAVELTPEAPTQSDLEHGTGVTGAALYGLLSPGAQVAQPYLPVDHYRVLPAPHVPDDLDGYWVLDQIKRAVVDGQYKIVNLSLGPCLAVEDTMEPNRWTSELDQLSWEHDVLFVVAAGNDGEQDPATGLHRIQVPGDMANGIAVGACDEASPALPWMRAPYSSVGPGRQGNRIQPVGVQFGGMPFQQFPVVRADGSFADSLGTSFAAPLVTHAFAELSTLLPRTSSSILRVFAGHFAERHRSHRKLRDEIGYGRFPLSFRHLLDCDMNEVHVLYDDEIERGELIGYQVPIPSRAAGDLELRVTLAYSSPVEPSQSTEYTRASLELTFRPHCQRYRFRPPKGDSAKVVELDMTSPEALELLKLGWQMGQEPISKGLGSASNIPEGQLRDEGKWETLRHARINLRCGEYAEPRIEVSYIARRSGGLDNSPTKVPFALLITVVDKSATGSLYEQTVQQFTALRPLQSITSHVHIRTPGQG